MIEDLIPSVPLTVAWNFTYLCNMNCEHCYSRTEQGKELSEKEKENTLKKLVKAGVMQINFGGGESLLCSEFMEIATAAQKELINVAVSSNGSLIDENIAESLARIKIDTVNISIDSPNKRKHDNFRNYPGSYDKAVTAIKLLKKRNVKTKIVTVLSRINHEEIEELIRLAEFLNIDELKLQHYKLAGKGMTKCEEYDLSPTEWEKLYKRLIGFKEKSKVNISFGLEPILYLITGIPGKEDQSLVRGTPCGKLSLCIKPNGDITPCAYVNLKLGNILTDDLLKIWEDSLILHQIRHKKPTGKCTQCSIFEWCAGGCFAAAYNTTGCLDSPDPHCWR